MNPRIGRPPRRAILAACAAAATLAVVFPQQAQAWYDIPVRASTRTIKMLRANQVDMHQLADSLRTAADKRDPDVAQARGAVLRDCPQCTWQVVRDSRGDPYIRVKLQEPEAEGELDTALMPKRALPSPPNSP